MNRRRPGSSIVANPVLVGAVTTLVVVVAVFLAYNANNGLPFVPTRSLNVEISNGSELVRGNEVRSGGFRIGVIDKMIPVRLNDGSVVAKLTLKLDKKIGEIPVDTNVVVRPRSSLGLKYLEFDKGTAQKKLPDGATLPPAQATVPVDLDQFYDMFDTKTRNASRVNLREFGDTFAGRGADLNQTIQVLPELLGHLEHVARNLNDPRTDLPSFFKELGDTVRIIAPVSATNAHLFTTMADTFEAIGRDPKALQDTITKNVDTLRVGTDSLRAQRPFLVDSAAFGKDLSAATYDLRSALPILNRTLKIGVPVTRRSIALNKDLQSALAALYALVKAPTTNGSLRGLGSLVTTLQPQLRFLGPFITVCNSWNQFWTFAAEHLSEPNLVGTEQRALLNGDPQPPNPTNNDLMGSDNANEFVHGANTEDTHAAYYGQAIDAAGNANCQAGQTGYGSRGNPFRDKSVPGDPYKTAFVDAVPFPAVGPDYKMFAPLDKTIGLGPARVPAGETYTASPGGIAAQLPPLTDPR